MLVHTWYVSFVLCSFVPPPSSVDSEADKDLSDLLDFSAVSDIYSEMLQ